MLGARRQRREIMVTYTGVRPKGGEKGGCVDRLAVQVRLGERRARIVVWPAVHVLEQIPRHHVVAGAQPELDEGVGADVVR